MSVGLHPHPDPHPHVPRWPWVAEAPGLPGRALSRPRAAAAARSWPWERLGLLGILLLSAILELWHLDQLGTSNSFYAAAVLSMTQNVHAFFFNSLDPVGFVTIDKPPLGFWIQALSAKLLGFSGFSILLPEALATVGSVALLSHLVKRAFGSAAGLLAGLMLTLVPISVVVGRNNTIDSLLVFSTLLAVWSGLRATERGSLTWLVLTGAIVGLGFEIKMLEAYLVVPALGLVYVLAAPVSWRARVLHLGLAAAVMLGVSLAWPVAVDLTPASLRPWVDSTQNNSAISLALGYNGIERLLGQNESVSQFLSGLGLKLSSESTTSSVGGGGGMFNNGAAGVFRLFDQQLAGQASWLLPLSMAGTTLAGGEAFKDRLALARSRRGQVGLVFGTWLLTAGAFFSVANFFHSYYLVTLGPPIAALAAMGVWYTWRAFRAGARLAWLLPVALLGTALVQAHILSEYPAWSQWLSPIVVGGSAVGAAVLVLALARERRHQPLKRGRLVTRAATGVAMVALLVAPAVWSGYSTLYVSSAGIPAAGPQVAGTNGGPGGGMRDGASGGASNDVRDASSGGVADDGGLASDGGMPGDAGMAGDGGMPGGGPGGVSTSVISYLQANQGSDTYLVATLDSQTAASIILQTNEPVMSLGGFTGDDPILTVDQFASLVESGQVRFVLLDGMGGGGQRSSNSAISQWVQANGTQVSALNTGGSQTQLFDLGSFQAVAAEQREPGGV